MAYDAARGQVVLFDGRTSVNNAFVNETWVWSPVVPTASVTVGTNISGGAFTVDGTGYTAPQTFNWDIGSSHTVDVPSPQGAAGNTRYTFASWSDGGAQSHMVTAPNTAMILLATLAPQYKLTTGISSGSGSIAANPFSPDGFYNAGASVQLTASPSTGFQFSLWGGDLSGSLNPASVVMNAPRSVTASFLSVPVCSYQLSSSATSVASTGDLRKVSVFTTSGCSWVATSNAPWVTILSGASGSGNGSVRFRLDSNTNGTPRTATLTIGGVAYSITQAAGGCSFNVSGADFVLPISGGTFQIAITASNSGCQWTAAPTPSWITLTSAASGTGNGTLSYSVSTNSDSSPRLGYITVGGQWWQVVQKGQSAQLFSDVPTNYPFFDSITLLKLDGISPGCGGTQYCPDAPMTRSEMAAFLIRALMGESFSYSNQPYFTDVAAAHPYFKYIQKLREIGVTNGCTLTTYCPDDTVTRGQMAAFVVRARLPVTYSELFPFLAAPLFDDVGSGNVFFSYVQKLKELGITNGCTTTTYCVNDPTTRGQMAVFVARSLLTP
jgi:hypothetical protein